MNIDKKDIEQYLSEVKEAVENDRYQAKAIILSLTAMDFSEILQNEHIRYEHERLYVFGKDVTLLERNGTEEIRRQNGGDYYDREKKKGLLHRMQEGNRIPFAEKRHRKIYKG